jgi:hypothetical protein
VAVFRVLDLVSTSHKITFERLVQTEQEDIRGRGYADATRILTERKERLEKFSVRTVM